MMRGSNHGSRFDEKSRSINGGLNLAKSAARQAEMTNRMNFAKQAQVDFMNSKYLGNMAAAPFVEKQSSVFMTESSMHNTTSMSPKMRINVQPLDQIMQATGSSQHRR